MLFLAENLADAGTWTSLFGSATNFPVANVQDPQTYRVWRSTVPVGESSDRLTLDLGAATTPAVKWYLVIHGHNIRTNASACFVWGYSVSIGTAEYSAALTIGSFFPGTMYLEIPAEAAGLRYWSIEFPNTSIDSDPAQIGRIYLGPAVDTTDAGLPNYDGFSRDIVDPSPSDYSPGGQRFVERKYQREELSLDFSYLSESIHSDVRDLYYELGTVDPFFIKPSDVAPLNRMFYVAFAGKFPEKVQGGDVSGGYLWSNRLALEQQL